MVRPHRSSVTERQENGEPPEPWSHKVESVTAIDYRFITSPVSFLRASGRDHLSDSGVTYQARSNEFLNKANGSQFAMSANELQLWRLVERSRI
jgi:hypothetical protein